MCMCTCVFKHAFLHELVLNSNSNSSHLRTSNFSPKTQNLIIKTGINYQCSTAQPPRVRPEADNEGNLGDAGEAAADDAASGILLRKLKQFQFFYIIAVFFCKPDRKTRSRFPASLAAVLHGAKKGHPPPLPFLLRHPRW